MEDRPLQFLLRVIFYQKRIIKKDNYPEGWDEDRVKRVVYYYENQTDNEAVAEDEAAWEDTSQTFIEVPNDLVPSIRELIASKVNYVNLAEYKYSPNRITNTFLMY